MGGKRYSTKAWDLHKKRILARDMYLCQMCGVRLTDGKLSHRSAVVDHKIPAKLEPDLFLDDENTWAVCRRCHDTTCASIEARHHGDAEAIRRAKEAHRPVGLDGYPIKR